MNTVTVLWIVLAAVVIGAVIFGVARRSARRTGSHRAGSVSVTRARTLIGRAVVTISDAGKVGTVDDVLLDPAGREVIGFRVKRARFSHGTAVVREHVTAMGPEAIMVPDPTVLNDIKRLPALADAIPLGELRGSRAVTEGGELLGKVSDLEVDAQARHVVAYVLHGSLKQRLRHHEPTIPVWQVTHRGNFGLMVAGERLDPAVLR